MSDEPPENRSDEIRLAGRAETDDEWIEEFLLEEPMCVLGLVDEGSPYLVNQLFVYDPDEQAAFLHGRAKGRTRTIVERADPADACLTVSRMGRLLPAEMPVDFDVEYESVVVFGEMSVVEGADRKRDVLERIMDTFAAHLEPGEDYDPIAEDSIERTSVYRVDIDGWSAKRNEKPDDFPARTGTTRPGRRAVRTRPRQRTVVTRPAQRTVADGRDERGRLERSPAYRSWSRVPTGVSRPYVSGRRSR